MNDTTHPDQSANISRPQHETSTDEGQGIASASKDVGQDLAAKASSVASDARTAVGDAFQDGRAYAKDAVNAAGKMINTAKSQFDQSCDYVSKAISDEPMKAVVITAVVSSLLTALLVSATRSNNRY